MSRTQSFLMGAAGALALLVLVVGVAWAADIFTIDQNGNVRLVITDTGNVGVGTTNPGAMIHVAGDGAGRRGVNLQQTTAGTTWAINNYETSAFEGAGNFGVNQVGAGARMVLDNSGNLCVGNHPPIAGARLEIDANAQGTPGAILIPRMTTAQRDALTAANGMIVYNTDTNAFNFYENGAWVTRN